MAAARVARVARPCARPGAGAAGCARRARRAPAPARCAPAGDAAGADDEERVKLANGIYAIVKYLEAERDLNPEELRLTLAIEDPAVAERREQFGIEDESGVSREELSEALADIMAERLPEDLLTLRVLAEEMLEWKELVDEDDTPRMTEEEKDSVLGRKASPYRSMADQVAGIKSEENLQDQEELLEKLGPVGKVVGTFSPYLVLGVPVIIVLSVVKFLWTTSLR